MLKKSVIFYFAITSINSFGMTAMTKLKEMPIQSIVFTHNKISIAELNTSICKTFSPIIKQSLEYKTTDINNNKLYWDLSDLKPASIQAFVDLLQLQHIKTIKTKTQIALQAPQALKNNDDSKIEIANITEEMHNIIKKPNIFFELLTLIDYFQVNSLAQIAAEQLPGLLAQHIQEPNIQKLNIGLIPPFIQENALSAFADNFRYASIVLPQNVQTLHATHNVNSIAFSPDSKFLAINSSDGSAKLLNLATNIITTPITHNCKTISIAFSPDSKFLASASQTLKLFELATNTVSASIIHNGYIHLNGFSSDNKFLATSSYDGYNYRVKLLDLTTNRITNAITHNDMVQSAIFSPDSKFLASSSVDKTIKLLNLSTNTINTPITNNGWINSIAFSPDSKFLACGLNGNTIKILNLATNTISTAITHDAHIRSIAFSPDGKFLASSWNDGTVKLLDLSTNIVRTIHDENIRSFAFSPDSKFLAICSFGNKVKLFNIVNHTVTTPITHNNLLKSIDFTPNNKFLISSWHDNTVKLLDLATNTVTTLITHHREVEHIAFSSDSKSLATSSQDNSVKIAHFGITGLPFDQALTIAILEELKISNKAIKFPGDDFIHKIIKKMSSDLQKFVTERYKQLLATNTDE